MCGKCNSKENIATSLEFCTISNLYVHKTVGLSSSTGQLSHDSYNASVRLRAIDYWEQQLQSIGRNKWFSFFLEDVAHGSMTMKMTPGVRLG